MPYLAEMRSSGEEAITRLVCALMLEQNDEWAVCRSHMTLETLTVVSEDQSVRHTSIAAA